MRDICLPLPTAWPGPTTSRLVRDGFQPTIPAFFQSPTLGTRPGGTKGDRDGLNLNCCSSIHKDPRALTFGEFQCNLFES